MSVFAWRTSSALGGFACRHPQSVAVATAARIVILPTTRNFPMTQLTPKNNAVATHHEQGAAAAAKMFEKGGNAIDAAVAAMLALCVVLPGSVGIGGYGGSFVIYLAKKRKFLAIDFDSRAPLAFRPELFTDPKTAEIGYLAISVPAIIAGLS